MGEEVAYRRQDWSLVDHVVDGHEDVVVVGKDKNEDGEDENEEVVVDLVVPKVK